MRMIAKNFGGFGPQVCSASDFVELSRKSILLSRVVSFSLSWASFDRQDISEEDNT